MIIHGEEHLLEVHEPVMDGVWIGILWKVGLKKRFHVEEETHAWHFNIFDRGYQDVLLILFSAFRDTIDDDNLSTNWALTIRLEVRLYVSLKIFKLVSLQTLEFLNWSNF